jgi:hypothetical protein
MKLQSVRIKTNDFPEDQKELADILGGILNPFVDKLVQGFNKNFTVEDNLPFEFKTIDIQVDATGTPLNNQLVNTSLSNFKGYLCINVLNINNLTLPSTAVSLFTQANGNFVTINKITGLPSDGVYRLVLLGIS